MDTTTPPPHGWRRHAARALRALVAATLMGGLGLVGTVPAANASSAPAPGSSTAASDSSATQPAADIPDCALGDLPPEASETLDLVHSDGPFPYPEDGTVFENREGILPDHPEGYYREYTVETPGSDDRGARRLVGGGDEPTQPDDVYYTDDHYESFCHITDEGGEAPEDPGGMQECPLGELPTQVAQTVDAVRSGEADGVRYENREGHLSDQPSDYYTVYTVDGGEGRRLVTGGGEPTDPAELYYTDDHYGSFCAVTNV